MSTDLAGDKTVTDARHIFMLAIECSINKCQELGFEHAVVMEAIKDTANSLISWGELADLINGPPASPPALRRSSARNTVEASLYTHGEFIHRTGPDRRGKGCAMSTIGKRLTVDQYDLMVTNGILPETNRLELIEGRIVEKDWMTPLAACAAETCRELLDDIVPAGWYVRCGGPVRIPQRDSEPEPEVSVVRGKPGVYRQRHPGPGDIALVVEVVRCDVADDRAMAATYGGGGIPVYWIIDVAGSQLEVYANPRGGAYSDPTIFGEGELVEVVIEGRVVGKIPVADLLLQAKGDAK